VSRYHWLPAGILLLALVVRLYGLFSHVYANPDEALWSYFITNTSALPLLSLDPGESALARLLSWDYGYPFFFFYVFYVRALDLLHLPLNEGTLALPLVVMGLGVCGAAGRLGTVLGGPRVGRLTLLWVALMPLTVVWSRSIGAALVLSSLLFILTILALVRLYEQPSSSRRVWWLGLVAGLYLCADVQFLLGLAALAAFLWLWPRPRGYEGWGGLWRLIGRVGVILPPVVLFVPYIPAWLYAIHLGYPDQTYLGTIFGEHPPDYGWHLLPFLRDLWHNMGLPLVVALVMLPFYLRHRRGDRRVYWLGAWTAICAAPFLFAVSSRVTQAWGYHEHLVVALALLVSLALSSLRSHWLRGMLVVVLAVGTLATTLGGVWRVDPLTRLWPFPGIIYGGVTPNTGMKTAGYWVRRQLGPTEQIFVATDPAVAYWYLGREAVTGGHIDWKARPQALQAALPELTVAIVPVGSDLYPPEIFLDAGLRLRSTVTHRGREVLYLYSRRHPPQTLTTEEYDRAFNAEYHTARTIIPPGGPYVPGKPLTMPGR
jgi:hypothetical protein